MQMHSLQSLRKVGVMNKLEDTGLVSWVMTGLFFIGVIVVVTIGALEIYGCNV